MPKTKISEYSATANSNTDVASINIDEGCAPSGINNAIRAIMGHLKDFQSGTSNDPFTVGSSGSLTLSGGTANGVAYLNGSKVLTTGSALVFDGTKLSIGSGNSTAAGLTAGYFGASGYGAIWSTSVTPSTTNFSFLTNGTSTVLNGSSNVTFQVNNADSMALTSTGLGIGTSSPTSKLSIESTLAYSGLSLNSTGGTSGRNRKYIIQTDTIGDTVNGVLAFYDATASAYRMVLDSSGNLLVADTSQIGAGKLSIKSDSAIATKGTTATGFGNWTMHRADTGAKIWEITGDSSTWYLADADFSNYVYVSQNFTAWTFGSDRRIKTDIADIEYGLDAVMAMKPRKYKMLATGLPSIGFIAQELQTVVPEAVEGEEIEYLDSDTPKEKAAKTMGVSKDTLIPVLVKAIQELKAEFDAYKASHP